MGINSNSSQHWMFPELCHFTLSPKGRYHYGFYFVSGQVRLSGGQSHRAGNDRAQPFFLCVSFFFPPAVQKTYYRDSSRFSNS